jgi:hypothetical protein
MAGMSILVKTERPWLMSNQALFYRGSLTINAVL